VPVLRFACVLLACSMGLHELRYALAFGGERAHALVATGHGYLAVVGPALGVVLAMATARWFVGLAGRRRASASRLPRFAALTALAATALLVVFGVQELVEGILAPGHPSGWAGVFGVGGWIAVPLAAGFGALAAGVLGVASRVEAAPAGRTSGWVMALAGAGRSPFWRLVLPLARSRPQADHRAGRGPPSLLV